MRAGTERRMAGDRAPLQWGASTKHLPSWWRSDGFLINFIVLFITSGCFYLFVLFSNLLIYSVILFNEGEDTAHIQTYNAGLRKRLAAFSKKHPDLCRLEKSFAQGCVIYVLDKSRLSIRLQAPYSVERRRKASEDAKQTGFKSRTE